MTEILKIMKDGKTIGLVEDYGYGVELAEWFETNLRDFHDQLRAINKVSSDKYGYDADDQSEENFMDDIKSLLYNGNFEDVGEPNSFPQSEKITCETIEIDCSHCQFSGDFNDCMVFKQCLDCEALGALILDSIKEN